MRICPAVSEADIRGFTIINKFTRGITMAVSTIVKTILAQMAATGKEKVWSWGASEFHQIDDLTLQFTVCGHLFQGHVRIFYDEGNDSYVIHFGHSKSSQWKNIETIDDIYWDNIVDVIDQKVF